MMEAFYKFIRFMIMLALATAVGLLVPLLGLILLIFWEMVKNAIFVFGGLF